MPKKSRIYVGLVILAGVATLAVALSRWTATDVARLGFFVGLTMVASAVKFRLPGITGTYSLNSIFLLAGVVYYSLEEVLLAACGAALVQTVANTKRRPTALQVAFNAAGEGLSLAAAYCVCRVALVDYLGGSVVLSLAVITVIQYLVNTMLVARMISLVERQAMVTLWHRCYFGSFPYYLVGAAAAGLMATASEAAGWAAALLVVPLMGLIYFSYKLHVEGRVVSSPIVK